MRSTNGGFPGSDPSPASGGAAGRARGPAEKERHDADQPSSQDVGPGAVWIVFVGRERAKNVPAGLDVLRAKRGLGWVCFGRM